MPTEKKATESTPRESWTCRVCGVVSPDLDAHWAHLTSDAHAAQLDARAGRTPRPRPEAR